MAYSTTNPVRKVLDFGITGAGSFWAYESTNAHGAIEAANFFAGCGFGSPSSGAVGMRVADLVLAINRSTAGTSAITFHRVDSLSTSTGFGSPIHATVSAASS